MCDQYQPPQAKQSCNIQYPQCASATDGSGIVAVEAHRDLPRAEQVSVVVSASSQTKSLLEAYLLWFPLGLLGLHQFYLRRPGFGVLYIFTGGLFGIGWIVDFFRMPFLVRETNRKILENDYRVRLSLVDAYILWFPFGILGFHHYYLRRPGWGLVYTFTAGLFIIGWLVDLFRMPYLVRRANETLEGRHEGQQETKAKLLEAYIFCLPPIGIFGAHHYYLKRYGFGVYYSLTAGGFGIGWLVDLFRMKFLVRRVNNPGERLLGSRHKHVDDAYILAFPLGLIGLHHFYLERPGWGVLYAFTGGLCGIGWLIDLIRMPLLVSEVNCRMEAELLINAAVHQGFNQQPYSGGSYIEPVVPVAPPHFATEGMSHDDAPLLQPPSYEATMAEGRCPTAPPNYGTYVDVATGTQYNKPPIP